MEADALHDLTAAYALDALTTEEARAYEAHLARCARCRDELAELSDTAATLAYGTEAPVPPAALRARILQQAAGERANVVPLRPRWAVPVAAAAAIAACAAVGLGLWATSLSHKLDRRDAQVAQQEHVAQILAQPGSRTVSFTRGKLVVAPGGDAALVLGNLAPAGNGRTYEAWIADGGAPQPAGVFQGGKSVAIGLEGQVRDGATVMVTREPAGGRRSPSGVPLLAVRNAAQS